MQRDAAFYGEFDRVAEEFVQNLREAMRVAIECGGDGIVDVLAERQALFVCGGLMVLADLFDEFVQIKLLAF